MKRWLRRTRISRTQLIWSSHFTFPWKAQDDTPPLVVHATKHATTIAWLSMTPTSFTVGLWTQMVDAEYVHEIAFGQNTRIFPIWSTITQVLRLEQQKTWRRSTIRLSSRRPHLNKWWEQTKPLDSSRIPGAAYWIRENGGQTWMETTRQIPWRGQRSCRNAITRDPEA